MDNAETLKNMWGSLYDPKMNVIEVINQYFHKDYTQCINGVNMNRDEYVQHIIEQKKNMVISEIEYKQLLENKNELFAIYYPKGTNTNNTPIEAEVIAYFHFENHKILRIHGLVRLIKGDLADVDMKDR